MNQQETTQIGMVLTLTMADLGSISELEFQSAAIGTHKGTVITPLLPTSLLGENKEENVNCAYKVLDSARAIPSRYNVNHP